MNDLALGMGFFFYLSDVSSFFECSGSGRDDLKDDLWVMAGKLAVWMSSGKEAGCFQGFLQWLDGLGKILMVGLAIWGILEV